MPRRQRMATNAKAKLAPILSWLLLWACTCVHGADDYSAFLYAGCSQGRYDAGSQYESDVDSVLTSLTNSAPYTAYANFTSPSPATSVVGLYQCRSDLPVGVCGGCVRSAVSKISSLCSSATGAAVQLRACFVRYGNDSFLGRQDTTVLFKKCGGAAGDASGAAMRDSALGALVAEAAPAANGGAYRAGGAGAVQAISQCVGDLGAKKCSDCVSAAAAQLKDGCGYATAGEVYLGKCYARFWSNGDGGYGYGSAPRTYGDHGMRLVPVIAGVVLVYISLVIA